MFQSKSIKRFGLTIIEMMTAFVIGSVVFLGTSAIIVGGQKSLDKTLQQANLQRNALNTLLKMSKFVRSATSLEVNPDGNEVTMHNPDGWTRFRFIRTQKDLRFQRQEQDEQILLDGIVEGTVFEIDPDTGQTMNVEIELTDGTSRTCFSSTTTMRNIVGGT